MLLPSQPFMSIQSPLCEQQLCHEVSMCAWPHGDNQLPMFHGILQEIKEALARLQEQMLKHC